MKLFQSSSSSNLTTGDQINNNRDSSINIESTTSSTSSKKRTSESATATAIVNSMSIDNDNHLALAAARQSVEPVPAPKQQPVLSARPKRVSKLLDEISDKKDQILQNVKPDNRQKHTASTSTPSGLRRRPLKAPQNVSLIIKPYADQSK